MRGANAKQAFRLGTLSEQKRVWAVGGKIQRFSETILESTKIDLDSSFEVKIRSQDRSPEHVFQGSNFETRLFKKCTPPRRKPYFCMLTRSENVSIWVSKIDQKSILFRHPSWKRFLLVFEAKMKVLGVQVGGQISPKIDLKTIRLKG